MGVKTVLSEWQNLVGGKIAQLVEETDGSINMYLGGTTVPLTTGNALAKIVTDTNNNQTGFNNGQGGVVGAIVPFDTSAAITAAHNGVTLASISGSAVTATVNVNTIAQATMFQMEGAGSVGFIAGVGVTITPPTLVTTAVGQIVTLLPTRVANAYNAKLSA